MSGTSKVRPLNVTRPPKRPARARQRVEHLVFGLVAAQEELPRMEPVVVEVAAPDQEGERPGAAAEACRLEVEEQQRARCRDADAPPIVGGPPARAPLQANGPRAHEAPPRPARRPPARPVPAESEPASRHTPPPPGGRADISQVVVALEDDAAVDSPRRAAYPVPRPPRTSSSRADVGRWAALQQLPQAGRQAGGVGGHRRQSSRARISSATSFAFGADVPQRADARRAAGLAGASGDELARARQQGRRASGTAAR